MNSKINHFTQLEAWKVAHQLSLEIYRVTKSFPRDERFGIIDQLRRASASITANIAEGWGRYHYADRNKFYYQARGSSYEVQSFLHLARDLGYVDDTVFQQLYNLAERSAKIINGLIRAVDNRKLSSAE